MKNIDAKSHLRGESIYLDDIPTQNGTLYAAVFDSPIAHGIIKNLDLSELQKSPLGVGSYTEGVVAILTYKDILGENQIGGIILDEPLLAEHHVHFCGMPIALVVAETEEAARLAVKKIKVEIEPLPIITDPREAFEKGALIIPKKAFKLGNTEGVWAQCKHIYEGKAESGGQEHLYIETQGAYAIPTEQGGLKIHSSTQGPTAVQRAVAKVTGLPMHAIEVDVQRLGGGFGGKEDQANPWAALCAVAAQVLKKPVKYALNRMEDMRMTGKRHPYSSDFKIGLDKNLKIIAYEATFYQNAGAAADLSPAVLERTLFHCTNAYFIPNVTATAYSCRTNLPPNTAFRGFGGPQGMFVIESAIAKAAEGLGVHPSVIQAKNLLETGDVFPYGQKAVSEAKRTWKQAVKDFDLAKIQRDIDDFNAKNTQFKKGFALMPICFGISFTKTLMNQARSLVHIYSDGSVNISTGAVEMGQGVNTKILQVAASIFGISSEHIRLNSTNTFRIANTSPSAASATADLNGKATQMACFSLINRLKEVLTNDFKLISKQDITFKNDLIYYKNEPTDITWKALVNAAFMKRVSLSEHAHYATPSVHFDWKIAKGNPFAYHVYGTAIVTATVDCLRGTYTMDTVQVIHDAGESMNPMVDRGQCEGGIVQGIGWMTMEELVYDKNGKLRSNALSTYKIPDIYSVPKTLDVRFLEQTGDNLAVFNSKAVGEPPLMYGIGAYFALRNAVLAQNTEGVRNPEEGGKGVLGFDAPMTVEKVLMGLIL
jgi:xanthine dehydrogenase large subunit